MTAIENLIGPSSRYRTAWVVGAAALTAIGLASSFAFIRLSGILILLVMVAAIHASIHYSVGLAQDEKPTALIVPVLTWSVRAALTSLAVGGYFAAVGADAVLLLLVVAGTSPRTLSFLSQSRAVHDEPAVDTRPPPETDLSVLPIEDLCLSWRHSFMALGKCLTERERMAVVNVRDGVLNELERRDPQAFAEWLESGPRAAGDPTPYFTHQAGHGGQG